MLVLTRGLSEQQGAELGAWVEFMCDGRVGTCETQKRKQNLREKRRWWKKLSHLSASGNP